MLDIGWSELFVVGVIALLVVGPKELPALLRTIGKYLGVLKRQAREFRDQFDEAIKDSEFEQVKKDFEELRSDATATVRDATRDIEDEMRELDEDIDKVGRDVNRELKKTPDRDDDFDDDAVTAADEEADWLDEYNKAVLEAEAEKTKAAEGAGATQDGKSNATARSADTPSGPTGRASSVTEKAEAAT